MGNYNFVTVDTLLAKFARELKDTTINESDIIEWIGEALAFMKVPSQNEEAVSIIPVNNYTAELPSPIKYLIQVARINNLEDCCNTCNELICECEEEEPDCHVHPLELERNKYILPGTYTRKYSYLNYLHYTRTRNISPMKLANSSFFGTLVCQENNEALLEFYNSCDDQYSIVSTNNQLNAIRTSFKQGYIIVSYIRPALDEETGYPMIPDEANHIQAVNYYVRWKIAEVLAWVGREGYNQLALQSEERWLKYIRQANNSAKMPKGIADYEDLKSQSLYLIPKTNKYNNYFGTLNRGEKLRF